MDLNPTVFPESCLESVDCDKLLTVFSVPRKLAVLCCSGVGVGLAGAEAKVSACLLAPQPLLGFPTLFSLHGSTLRALSSSGP